KIDFDNSPFYVNTQLKTWENDTQPLRAGVSSFGIGGTNAHVVLEEWRKDSRQLAVGSRQKEHLILFSAKTPTALDKMTDNLCNFFKENHLNDNKDCADDPYLLADTAYTLQKGRRHFSHRRMLVCAGVDEAARALSSHHDPGKDNGHAYKRVRSHITKIENPPVYFMFAGLGGQYVNMGRELYEKEPVFQQQTDRCFELLEPLIGYDIKEILYPGLTGGTTGSNKPVVDINEAGISQILIFVIEYALARLLMHWGIQPAAMMGYSFGEYTAACISGVFSLADALHVVVSRGQLIEKLPGGAMLSVPLPGEEVAPFLTASNNGLSLAIDNGPSCIIAGGHKAIVALEEKMKEKRLICMRLSSSHALHSKMMEPILKEFEEIVANVTLNKPQIPYISNRTGDWIAVQDALSPAYWA
ncbi:MAG: type I polyketide synthase, partial [bacterium]|nr:type I polyketide synthase [bacterium]